MLPNPIRPGRTSTPPFVHPYLDALNRIQERHTLRPGEITERARMLLDNQFGTRPVSAETAFAHGGAGLLSEHTHYFEGFAVVKCLSFGAGIAARIAAEGPSRVVFEGGQGPWPFDSSQTSPGPDSAKAAPYWARIVQDVVRRLATDRQQVEIAVVSTVPPSCLEGYLAALGVATARCYQGLSSASIDTPALLRLVTDVITTSTSMPFSVAYPVAADCARPNNLILIDTSNLEHLPLEAPSGDVLGWGMIDVAEKQPQAASFYRAQKAKADEAVAQLRSRSFPQLTSLRDLDHSDLQRALGVLSRSYRPIIRYLVTENRRVNKLVFASGRHDWQMFGALLLMSHASRRSDFKITNEKADFVIEQIEGMSLEGMYGGCMSGRGGCVLATGLPFVVPSCLDTIDKTFKERFGTTVVSMLL